ncbi:RGS22 protein, partial [Crypturellus undulatus]|nr:RGS22 protein [Crypturellus undulatus]
TFAHPVKFNPDFGVFEVVDDAPQRLESQLKKILHDQKPPNPIYDVIRKAKNDGQLPKKSNASPALNIDPNYNTMRLHREQAIQWVKKERLPAFLESDCYFEYRLAKLISQVKWSKTGINFIIDRGYYPWIRKRDPSPPFPEEDATSSTMKKFYVSLGKATLSQTEDWFTLAKQSESMKNADPLASRQIHDVHFLPGQHERNDLSEELGFLEAGFLSTESHQWSFLSPSRTAPVKSRKRSRKAEEGSSVAIAASPSQLRVYVDQNWESAGKEENEQGIGTFQTLEEFISAYVQFILMEAISNLTGKPVAKSETVVDFNKLSKVFIQELANKKVSLDTTEPVFSQSFSPFTALDSKCEVLERNTEEASLRSSSESEAADIRAAWCTSHRTYDVGNRHEFERFKKFIQGTLGERYWWLWMDIERLKVLKGTRKQQRQLDKMKKLYLLSGGDYWLSSEVLLRLDLLRGDQWNTTHLRKIQPEVVKPLLLYWGPRFCVTHSTAIQTASAKLKLWHTHQERPRVDIDPFPQMVSLLPLRPKSCLPRIAHIYPQTSRTGSPTTLFKLATNFSLRRSSRLSAMPSPSHSPQKGNNSSSRRRPKTVSSGMIRDLALDDTADSEYKCGRKYTYAELLQGKSAAGNAVLGGPRMESMLQSLYLENRAGYYFTHFCEKSGNKLWENSAYFWFDLQAYHQLFYQKTIHHFKIGKEAQFLYATYIAPSANMDIGLRQNKKYEIYKNIDPAFEDLFDSAEEYVLNLLLEPWMKMVEEDRCTYEKVELVEETRQLDSVYFRKLQALHQESVSKKDESTAADTGLPTSPDVLQKDEHLYQVPQELAGPNLYDLIHDKKKLEQFRVFLDEHSAGMDLKCWLDIEQFRRMLHKDKEEREEKSKDIKNKYLNKKYFFGPQSPATKEQQEQLMRSGGGWGQILHDQVSPEILLEIQQYVQKRLEKQWLPLFLADERHDVDEKAKIRDIVEDLLIQKKEKTTRMWKASEHVDNKWVSSSREIIAFRKALSNPVTANQFQHFVSLKGDLLANGVLFWQEVQKYKDLCHSHCDNATIQNKITTIINCFINSAVPPALQIDIPVEQAEKILEHRKELGPYIFREAQMTIFALLFKFWPNFCEFRSNLATDNILPALKRRKERLMQKKRGKTAEVRPTAAHVRADRLHTHSFMSKHTGIQISFFSADFFKWFLQVSWSYSKYIEALEQERILLKMQEDLEKNPSPLLSGSSSMSLLKPRGSERFLLSPRNSKIFEKRSDLPRESEYQIANS